uniref:Phosphatidylinositol-4-phosphate 3-kinase n=1 Tax=Eptatretus burgeri TaxID=7764 RepID=A0A8C4QM49_EPTBU
MFSIFLFISLPRLYHHSPASTTTPQSMTLRIRESFSHSDTETNPGWSLAQARVPAGPQGLLFRVLVDYGRKEGPVIFSTDSDSPVELLLIQLLCLLSLELPSVQQLQHYFLQPHGLQQVLQRERSVVSHDCVQRSQRVGQLPHFQLLHSTDKILAFARTAKDDETPTSLDIDWTAHGCTRRKALGRQGMSMMMDMYHSEVETLRLNQTLTPGGVDRMVQAVKAACLSMDSVETAAVTAGVRALRCLSLAGDSVNSDKFPDSFWEPVTASHQPPLEALTSALHDICDLFRRTFRTEPITSLEAPCGVQNMTVEQSLGIAGNNGDEEVRTDNECESHRHERTVGETESEEMVGTMEGDETDEVEIIFGGEIVEPTKGCDNALSCDNAFSCDNSFQCIFSSSLTTDVLEITLYALHKLPSAWLSNYENYHMECRVWHGSKELGKAWKSQQVTPSHHFFQLVLWNERRTFPLSLSQLPRESRLTFDLYGLAPPPLSDTGTAPAVPHVPELLGHADLRIFDFQSVLVQGSQLLPLCLCRVEEGLERGPLFELHFPQLGCEVVFQTPSPARLAPPRPPRDLDTETRKRLITMMAGASVLFSLTKSECTWLWSRRASLKLEPGSLPWLLASAPSWDSEALPRIYSLLRDACISPEHALEMLHPLFPDKEVRHAAVRSLRQLTDDELMDWLPQLVQALQSEWHIDSCLAHFLLTRASASVRVAHHLYWQLRVSLANGNRRSPVANQAVLAALLSCIGSAQHQALAAQSRLVKMLHKAAGNVRHAPQGQPRRDALSASIPSLQDFFSQEGQVRLPLDPEFVARGIDKDGCSYFSSYTVPLRLSFLNAQPGAPNLEFIFKTGDDMRQDALALQLMALMDRLWLRDGLDMHCVSFRCQPTGYRQGLVELVPGAETLRQIQTRHGVTGSFRDSLLSAWLREHNPSARQLQQAEERFIASCAGSCVATYVLGVCDRHNDNVLLCPSGSLFHIDFGRWLGHAQTLGNIRRDRVPFVLTADMAYIINGADHTTSRFDDFVDICCQAYNCLRKHTRLILVHLALMMECGLPELSSSRDLRYVQEALLPGVTEQQAADMFTSLIKASLSSLSTRVNFFIHNLAQLRQPGGGSSRNSAMGSLPTLSFVPSVHSLAADGRVTTVTVVNYEKRYNPEKYYVFVVEVKREGQTGASRVFRSFLEFQELHAKLCMLPAGSFVPRFPTRLIIGRAQTREVAARRAADLHGFLQILLRCPPAISESDLLYTFLHPLPHDHPRANLDIIQTTPEGFEVVSLGNVAGELSLEICYRNGRLFVLILSCRGLVPETGLELAPFVRTLLLPDPHRSTKRKTRSLNHSLNPDFCEMLVYGGYSEEALSRRRLHLSVCSDGSMTILGTTVFPLSDMIFPGPHTFTLTLHTNPLA